MNAYHSSYYRFTKPEHDIIASINASKINSNPNGLLGLWCSFSIDMAHGYGDIKYVLTYTPNNILNYDMSEFKDMCLSKSESDFIEFRESLIEDGIDVIHVLQSNGGAEMAVILNFDIITSFKEIT